MYLNKLKLSHFRTTLHSKSSIITSRHSISLSSWIKIFLLISANLKNKKRVLHMFVINYTIPSQFCSENWKGLQLSFQFVPWVKVINVSSGTDGGAVSSWKCYVHCIYFSLGGSRGQLKGRQGAVSSGKKSYPLHLYFFDAMGKLGCSRGQYRGI